MLLFYAIGKKCLVNRLDWHILPSMAVKKLESVPVEALIPYARNARKHSDEQVAQLAASIREFGFNNPVLIDKDNGIIAGHGRVLAARKLNLQEVPCIRLDHLTETQRKAYILADNRLAELGGGWDEEMLGLELSDLRETDFDLNLAGFDAQTIERFLNPPEPTADHVPETSTEEINADSFQMECKCPRCGFEFDRK